MAMSGIEDLAQTVAIAARHEFQQSPPGKAGFCMSSRWFSGRHPSLARSAAEAPDCGCAVLDAP